jgi:serine O-acetyltransferase
MIGTVMIARQIGHNVTPVSNVTLGTCQRPGFPVMGNNGHIRPVGPVRGPSTVGDGANIRANAVVPYCMPADATLIGVPAHIIEHSVGEAT